jgi:carbamoyltransferase
VNTADDAVTCFLTSGLTYLVAGDYLVSKREMNAGQLRHFRLWLSPCTRLTATRVFTGNGDAGTRYAVLRNYDETKTRAISAGAFRVIEAADGHARLDDTLAACALDAGNHALMDELFDLWSDRFVVVRP